MKRATQYTTGATLEVVGFDSAITPAFRQRLLSLGLLPGSRFTIIRTAPLGDPIEIETRSTRLALRRKDLSLLGARPLSTDTLASPSTRISA